MIELALSTGWSLAELRALDEFELATVVDVLAERSRRRG
jgi:hypothetical protein